jgi:carboxyl-terminal processing protease
VGEVRLIQVLSQRFAGAASKFVTKGLNLSARIRTGIVLIGLALVGGGCAKPSTPPWESSSANSTVYQASRSGWQTSLPSDSLARQVLIKSLPESKLVVSDSDAAPVDSTDANLKEIFGEFEEDAFDPTVFDKLFVKAIQVHIDPSANLNFPFLMGVSLLAKAAQPALLVIDCPRLGPIAAPPVYKSAGAKVCLVERTLATEALKNAGGDPSEQWFTEIDKSLLAIARSLAIDEVLDIEEQIVAKLVAKDRTLPRNPYPSLILLHGRLLGLDPHSRVFNVRSFAKDMSGVKDLVGVGLMIRALAHANGIYIHRVLPGSPADSGGIKRGDRLVSVDGQAVDPSSGPETVSRRIRGQAGTTVRIDVERAGSPLTFELKRARVEYSSVHLETYQSVDVVVNSEFSSPSAEQMQAIYARTNAPILDLRSNTGGDLEAALKQIGIFLKPDHPAHKEGVGFTQVGLAKFQQLKVERWQIPSSPVTYSGPLVVLVNEMSASASEIVASILKSTNRALIVGGRTFGKGSVQQAVEWPGKGGPGTGFGLALTIGLYYTYGNFSPQLVGVEPHVRVDSDLPKDAVVPREASEIGALVAEKLPNTKGYRVTPAIKTAVDCLEAKRGSILSYSAAKKVADPLYDKQMEFAIAGLACLKEARR